MKLKIFSIFRNDKEVSEKFRYESSYADASSILSSIVNRYQFCWSKFCVRHLACGGIIKNFDNFIDEAIKLGYCIKEVEMEKNNE